MTRFCPFLKRSFYGIPIYQNFDFWFRRTNNH
uniref:Photosystem II subunit 30 n=1 Tax=Terminalia neotaliala TaxID=1799636 RepID=A0A859CP91_9MYRT|nr:photosystem II subunit 30 [Terminalia neotaliala]YP_010297137.1 photosystem II subunit 30 [Terminalia myriocarpa]QKJ81576.1 photosystem II subunit 30 [Terminalia neotaliala]UMI39197.1 photosystem II subunit 30 [Terminalia myriocarpa]